MKILVLDRSDSWHANDLVRAAGSNHVIETAPYDRVGVKFADADGSFSQSLSEFDVNGCSADSYHAIIARAMPASSLEQVVFRMDWLDQFAHQHQIVVANPAKSIEACVDKYLSLEKMRAFNLPIPQTHVSQTATEALNYFVDAGNDCVIKPIFGSRGRGIVRVSNVEDASRLFDEFEADGKIIYQQRFIDHGESDLRLFVVGDNVFAMSRHRPGQWITNASLGAKCSFHAATPEESELAISAAQSQGAFVAGVDIVYEGNQPFIVEVNACPSWRMISTITEVDISSQLLQLLCDLC